MAEHYDIVISGGGPVGAALALGLTGGIHRVALIEARPPAAAAEDARVIALSHGSRLILERLGVWPKLLDLTPIRRIHVSQHHHFGRAELGAAEAGVPALGYVAAYAALQGALLAALHGASVEVMAGCAVRELHGDAHNAVVSVDCGVATRQITARLAVMADGGEGPKTAPIHARDYRQSAVVCNLASEQPHQNRAFERFTPQGPLALLPTPHGWSLIWTAHPDRARELAAMDEAAFCAELRAAFGASLGEFRMLGARQVFPLVLKTAQRPRTARTVLIGNAAQSLHPVAGQGFNLGLRDAWELAIAARDAPDPGSEAIVNPYFSQRRFDRTATILFTDTLIRLFSNNIPLIHRICGGALAALSGIPPAKNFLVRRMLFGARG